MSVQRVLHVEDAADFRMIIAAHLRAIEEHQFDISSADGEAAGLALFEQGGCDLAIVDYELEDGNGLHCVERLRKLDPFVPIIAISGRATEEVAGDLLKAGVDDYFDKARLKRADFKRAVLAAIERGQHWRASRDQAAVQRTAVARQLAELSQQAAELIRQQLGPQIDACAAAVRALPEGAKSLSGLNPILAADAWKQTLLSLAAVDKSPRN
jgi:DNA-binding response OmpR family regulator